MQCLTRKPEGQTMIELGHRHVIGFHGDGEEIDVFLLHVVMEINS